MNDIINLTAQEIKQRISSERLKPLLILNFALPFGAAVFLLIVFIIFNSIEMKDLTYQDITVEIFYVIGIIIFTILLTHPFIMKIVEQKIYNPGNIKRVLETNLDNKYSTEVTDPIQKLLTPINIVNIISLAIYESASLMGTVALMIAVQNGAILLVPSLWVFATPTAIMFLQAAINFPTKDKVASTIEEKIIRHLKTESIS